VVAALRADVQIALDFGAVQHRIAGRAFGPQPSGTERVRRSVLMREGRSFEPGHGAY
jgi:hypothetical protein